MGEYADRSWSDDAKRYASMVTRMDRDVGEIAELLMELGLAENTLLMVSSDNGPIRDPSIDSIFNSNGPYRGFKRDL